MWLFDVSLVVCPWQRLDLCSVAQQHRSSFGGQRVREASANHRNAATPRPHARVQSTGRSRGAAATCSHRSAVVDALQSLPILLQKHEASTEELLLIGEQYQVAARAQHYRAQHCRAQHYNLCFAWYTQKARLSRDVGSAWQRPGIAATGHRSDELLRRLFRWLQTELSSVRKDLAVCIEHNLTMQSHSEAVDRERRAQVKRLAFMVALTTFTLCRTMLRCWAANYPARRRFRHKPIFGIRVRQGIGSQSKIEDSVAWDPNCNFDVAGIGNA